VTNDDKNQDTPKAEVKLNSSHEIAHATAKQSGSNSSLDLKREKKTGGKDEITKKEESRVRIEITNAEKKDEKKEEKKDDK
jgi:hypothetical protein